MTRRDQVLQGLLGSACVLFAFLLGVLLIKALERFLSDAHFSVGMLSLLLPVLIVLTTGGLLKLGGRPWRFGIGGVPGIKTAAAGVGIGVATVFFVMFPATLAWQWILDGLHIGYAMPDNNRILLELPYGQLAFPLVSMLLISPWSEEIIFRRYIFDNLVLCIGKTGAAVLASALFALAHCTVLQFAGLFLLGLLLQCAAAKTGSLKLPMIIHGTVNLTAVSMLLALRAFSA